MKVQSYWIVNVTESWGFWLDDHPFRVEHSLETRGDARATYHWAKENNVNQRISQSLAVMLVAVFTCQPVLGVVYLPYFLTAGPIEKASVEVDQNVQPVLIDPEGRINLLAARGIVAGRLVELGRTAEEAQALASLLTLEDLDVLLSHPGMMQEAGAMSAQSNNLIMGLLVLGGLIALAYAGDGFIIRN